MPKICFFGGIFWDLWQTESAACFIPLWFYAREDTFEFQNQNQRLHFMCFSYSGRGFISLCSSLSPFPILLSSCLYVTLKTLLIPSSHVQLPVLHKFWTDAISEWGRKYTGILFLRGKLKVILLILYSKTYNLFLKVCWIIIFILGPVTFNTILLSIENRKRRKHRLTCKDKEKLLSNRGHMFHIVPKHQDEYFKK